MLLDSSDPPSANSRNTTRTQAHGLCWDLVVVGSPHGATRHFGRPGESWIPAAQGDLLLQGSSVWLVLLLYYRKDKKCERGQKTPLMVVKSLVTVQVFLRYFSSWNFLHVASSSNEMGVFLVLQHDGS